MTPAKPGPAAGPAARTTLAYDVSRSDTLFNDQLSLVYKPAAWQDGRATAVHLAAQVKANLQLPLDSPAGQAISSCPCATRATPAFQGCPASTTTFCGCGPRPSQRAQNL